MGSPSTLQDISPAHSTLLATATLGNAAKRPLILTTGDVPVGDLKLVGGYQGAALALSQPPVAAVVGTAAAAGDTVSVPEPCPGKGRSRQLGSSTK